MITGNTHTHEPSGTYRGAEESQGFIYAETVWLREGHRHQGGIEDVNIKMKPQLIQMLKQRERLFGQVIGTGFSEHGMVEVKDVRSCNQIRFPISANDRI